MEDLISRKKLVEAFEQFACPREKNTYLYKGLLKLVKEAPREDKTE